MPDYRDVRVDMTLTNFVRNYPFTQLVGVADTVAPVKPVGSSVGRYKTWGREWLRVNISDAVAQRGKANEIRFEAGEGTYECMPYALKTLVTDREIREAANALDPLKQAALLVTAGLNLRKEIRVATLAALNTTYVVADVTDWDNDAAVIVANINAAKTVTKSAMGGIPPTHILFGDHVADEIVGQQDIVAMLQAAAAMSNPQAMFGALTAEALPPSIMGLKKLVPNLWYDSAVEGHATEHLLHSWGDDAYVFHIDPGMETATWAIQPESLGFTITRWRENDPAGWWIKAEMERDEVEVTAYANCKIIDVT